MEKKKGKIFIEFLDERCLELQISINTLRNDSSKIGNKSYLEFKCKILERPWYSEKVLFLISWIVF